ncbi:hypothetical protein MX630_04905 [Carnobacterium divergens]|uniref:hypothetical protein n=1 Tax=Carnobacterium divergens TaxID=2748 RepID=UPI00288E32D3|nr:hypothetical protein [Carnobacterium divergens]MDT1950081.1 hypothetical protein [Carnobacterium divergens]MDT1955259.1 hypothetical protein [Carnobacterium divergens]MDT1960497.1 hypothetical protein [Carnobacterium divergens]MDT1963041.1 hypothetical protein [Carnobacterium divergens]
MKIEELIVKRKSDVEKLEKLILQVPVEMQLILNIVIGILEVEIKDLLELKKEPY